MKTCICCALLLAASGCSVDIGSESPERIGEAAQTLVSTNVSATFQLNETITNIKTGDMPKGWYKPLYSKSPITVTWTASASDCAIVTGSSLSSLDAGTGTFTAVQNNGGSDIGYWWSANHDLSALPRNHWHNHIACDGTPTVVGCPAPRVVNYTLSVGGACLTAGGTCSASGSVSLDAIQDADDFELNCASDCEESLGECISGCQKSCANGDSECSRCCECQCKYDLYVNKACEAPQNSCYGDETDVRACLQEESLFTLQHR